MPTTNPKQIVDISQDAAYNSELAASPQTSQMVQPSHLSKFKLTWTKDKPDARDRKYASTSTGVSKVDLRQFAGLVEDQGSLGSCTGHAVSSAMEIILKRQNREIEISRLFIYYNSRLIEGTVSRDAGSYLRNSIKACNKVGAPDENLWRYDIRQFRNRPTPAAFLDASRRRVTEYQRCDNFAMVKSALSNGDPVVVGFLVYSSFMTSVVARTGMMPHPNTRRERLLGGHAVCLVGYDDDTQRFIAKNSWGANWGDRGYFYMPYSVIQNTSLSSDFWVIRDITR